MIKDRFFYLLNQLNSKEFKQFKRYLLALSDNRRIRSIKMSQCVWDFLQEISSYSKKIELFKHQLFKECFPDLLTYDNLLLNKHLHYLSQQVEEFLILQEVRNNKLKKQEMLMSVAQSRRMTKEYFVSLEKQTKLIKAHPEQSFTNLYIQFHLIYQNYFHPEIDKARKGHKGKSVQQVLEDSNKQLDLFYWTAKYRIACEMILRREKIKGLIHEDLDFTEEEAPVLYMYKAIFDLLKEKDIALYPKAKRLVLAHLSKVNNEEQNAVIILLYNFQAMQLGQAENIQKVYEEMINIAKIGFEEEYFGQEFPLDQNVFIGFYQIARIVDTEWADFLLENYTPILSSLHQKNTYNLCKAFYAFDSRDFEEALLLLQKIEYNNFTYLLRARVLLVMCYYELRVSHQLDVNNEANNFSRHLKTNRTINKNIKLMFSNFTKFVRKLSNKQLNILELENDILQTRALASKKWLLEKINSLKKQKALS